VQIKIDKKTKWELVKFGLVGLINTGVTALAITMTTDLWSWPLFESNIAAYSLGLTVSFFLNKKFTFESKGKTFQRAMMFLGVFAVSYSLQFLFVLYIQRLIDSQTLSQLAGMLVYTPTSFVLNKVFTFNDRWYKN
jgi:putative flippase GtrA